MVDAAVARRRSRSTPGGERDPRMDRRVAPEREGRDRDGRGLLETRSMDEFENSMKVLIRSI